MNKNDKINQVKQLAQMAPVLALGLTAEVLGPSTVIEASIDSKELGIVNTARGLKTPRWFYEIIKGNGSHQIVIDHLDLIDQESQGKFYELLKYKTISDVALPKDCQVIVLAQDLSRVAESIIRLCLVVE